MNLLIARDVEKARIRAAHGKDLLVAFAAVHHHHHADGAHLLQASGEARLIHQHQNVERVAVVAQRTRQETVVAGIVHGRV